MNQITCNGFARISKAQAIKAWNDDKPLIIVPCKMNPISWAAITVTRHDTEHSFDTLYNAFVYYNCNNETGYYPAYYIKVGDRI